jgi:hypothetical protein
MVRAILSGQKTHTRRVVKPPSGYAWIDALGGAMVNMGGHKKHISDLACPYGQPGDRLWVKETRALHIACGSPFEGTPQKNALNQRIWSYRADNHPDVVRLLPSIHMPRWASRITLEITGVRLERLQDISRCDAIAEGIRELTLQANEPGAWWSADSTARDLHARNPEHAYRKLWESINGAGSWEANPWVWVVEFKQIQPLPGIDAAQSAI